MHNSNLTSRVSHKGCPRRSPGARALLLSAIGVLLLSSACAKRPEVASVAPPTVGGPVPQERGEQRSTQPGLRPPVTEPGATSEAGGPSSGGPPSGGPRGGPESGPMAQKPGEEGAPGAGAAPSTSRPPGSEVIAPQPFPPREEPLAQLAQPAPKESPLKDIFFDFDKAEIRADAKTPLAEDISWLKKHPQAAVTIEGHCDERGTSEYNLGLGHRRAKAAKDYLVASSIDGKRIVTVSYGKERPFVLGHDETAWRWNRRVHFIITKE
jgi:peptidoglycan-associated lipoprotein